MPNYLCIPVQYLMADKNIKTDPVVDSQGRSWYCGQLPELTPEIESSFGSPYAGAAWELSRLKPLLDQLHLPTPELLGEWPSEVREIYRLAMEVKAESIESLAVALANEEMPAKEQPINLNPQPSIKLPQSALSRDERKHLLKQATNICKRHRENGSEKYFSGELRHNRYNYAKDIIRAADYALKLIESIPTDEFCIEAIQNILEHGETSYLEENEDMEGFAIGTLRCIQNEMYD